MHTTWSICSYSEHLFLLGFDGTTNCAAQNHARLCCTVDWRKSRRVQENVLKSAVLIPPPPPAPVRQNLCTGGDMMSRWEKNRRLRYSEDEVNVSSPIAPSC